MPGSPFIAAGSKPITRPGRSLRRASHAVHETDRPRDSAATGSRTIPDRAVAVVRLGPPRTNHIIGWTRLQHGRPRRLRHVGRRVVARQGVLQPSPDEPRSTTARGDGNREGDRGRAIGAPAETGAQPHRPRHRQQHRHHHPRRDVAVTPHPRMRPANARPVPRRAPSSRRDTTASRSQRGRKDVVERLPAQDHVRRKGQDQRRDRAGAADR